MKYEFPIWENLETKARIRVKAVREDGTQPIIIIPVDETNVDYQQLMESFTIEDIDANSEQLRAADLAAREKRTAQQAEAIEQKKANNLFNVKIEAFEMPIVQSASKEWKAKIRKATTTVEVIATVAALIIKEGDNVESASGAADAQ